MVIIETSVFTRQVLSLLTDAEYRQFQQALAEEPRAGSVIKGSGGPRKIRRATRGHGKSGGVRVIYFWADSHDQLFLLLIYSKSDMGDLTQEQIKKLQQIIEAQVP